MSRIQFAEKIHDKICLAFASNYLCRQQEVMFCKKPNYRNGLERLPPELNVLYIILKLYPAIPLNNISLRVKSFYRKVLKVTVFSLMSEYYC